MASKTSQREGTAGEQHADMPEWAGGPEVTEQAASGTVAQRDNGNLPAGAGPATQQLIDWLAERATETDVDTFAAMEAIMARVLTAESPEDVLREQLPIHGKEFLDRVFVCTGFTVREGEYEEGAPWYAVMDVLVGSPPEPRVVTCGGWRVLAQLMMLERLGEWPVTMQIRGIKTKKGFTTLRLDMPV